MSAPRDVTQDIQLLLRKFRQYWYWLALGLLFGLLVSYIYLRYTIPIYKATGTLLITDKENSSSLSDLIINDRLGLETSRSLDVDMYMMRSIAMIEQVVEALNLEVSYIIEGRVKNRYDYRPSFVEVDFYRFNGNQRFELQQIGSSTYQLLQADRVWSCNFGDTCLLDDGLIAIRKRQDVVLGEDDKLIIDINSINHTAQQIANSIRIKPVSSQGIILEISLEDTVPERAIDIINKLFEIYERTTLQQKTASSENTLRFIDDRLDTLTAELNTVESTVERYRRTQNIPLNLERNANQTIGTNQDAQAQLSELEIQLSILQIVKRSLTDAELSYQLLPANLGSNTEVLTPLITEHNDLIAEREQLLKSVTVQHPSILNINKQIADLRSAMLGTIDNLIRDLSLKRDQINAAYRTTAQALDAIPRKERELLEIGRQQQIKENLYLFLLQKREEVALSLAGTSADISVLNKAYAQGKVSPDASSTYAAASVAGLLIALSFIILKELLSNKIETLQEVKHATTIPILGSIPFHKSQQQIVVEPNNQTVVNELFRRLRTHFVFTASESDSQLFVITSAIAGEGKTYITVNLGIALALSNKKTLLMDTNFRQPKLMDYLALGSNANGLSNYLNGEITAEKIIQQHPQYPHLYYISSGTIPSNPTELLMEAKMEELLAYCRSTFDYVLIDSPSVHLVTDALLFKSFVDRYIFVVRQNYTPKSEIKMLEELKQNGRIPAPLLLVNGTTKT